MWTDPSFDEARARMIELTLQLARLGEAENVLWRFVIETRKTRKRVNALKYNIIPGYRATLRYIRAVAGGRGAQHPVPVNPDLHLSAAMHSRTSAGPR